MSATQLHLTSQHRDLFNKYLTSRRIIQLCSVVYHSGKVWGRHFLKAAVTLSWNWSPIDTRKWSIAWCSGICWHAKDFTKYPEVDADAGETQPGFIQWLIMRLRMAQCFYNAFMITCKLRDSVRSAYALFRLEGVCFLTIWNKHKPAVPRFFLLTLQHCLYRQ